MDTFVVGGIDDPDAMRWFASDVIPAVREAVARGPVNHADLVALIEGRRRRERGGRWADLGAGEGAFTLALADAARSGRSHHRGRRGRAARCAASRMRGVEIIAWRISRGRSDLRTSTACVMANSLHFVRDKKPVLEAVRGMLRPGGRLIVVEYGTDRGNPWVPHPFTLRDAGRRWRLEAGFEGTRLLRTVPSRYLGSMYSAASEA